MNIRTFHNSCIEPIPANTIRGGIRGSQYFQSEPKLLLSETMAKIITKIAGQIRFRHPILLGVIAIAGISLYEIVLSIKNRFGRNDS